MNYPRSLSRRGQRALAERLDRLRLTLESLSDRVRSAVAEAVGQGVAGLVHDALLTLLDDLASRTNSGHLSSHRTNPAAWGDREDQDWAWDDEESQWPEEELEPDDR